MARLAIISDLHLGFWARKYGSIEAAAGVARTIINAEPYDILIDCGDQEFTDLKLGMGKPEVYVMGNHDYYGTAATDCSFAFDIDGVRIVGTTLWTNLNSNDILARMVVQRYLVDFRHIDDFTPDTWLSLHNEQVAFLEKEIEKKRPDIIVTHHCPSLNSCHPKFKQSPPDSPDFCVNFGFASHLDFLVESSEAKIWAHGHTHDAHDYFLGETRVICNPLGYPRERFQALENYRPVYVEV